MKYKDIIEKLKVTVDSLEKKEGVTVDALTSTIQTLEKHADDISALEENIDAIRSEITTPVLRELGMGQILSKTSLRIGIIGACIGALGIGFSVYTNLKTSEDIALLVEATNFVPNSTRALDPVQTSAPTLSAVLSSIADRLERIENEIVPAGLYQLEEFQTQISAFVDNNFAGLEDREIGISFLASYTIFNNGIMGTRFTLKIDGVQVGNSGLAGPYIFLERELENSNDLLPEFEERIQYDSIYLFEGEVISVYGNQIEIVDINTIQPRGRPFGDQANVVQISINPTD